MNSQELNQFKANQNLMNNTTIHWDDEDLYIAFNLLYRIAIGLTFHPKYDKAKSDENEQPKGTKAGEPQKSPEQYKEFDEKRLDGFKLSLSSGQIQKIMRSDEFKEIANEIFSSKYSKKIETHHLDALYQEVKSGVGINEPTESSLEMNSDLMESLERIKEIKNRIVEAKSGIQKCSNEILGLTSHVISRVFNQSRVSEQERQAGDEPYNLDEEDLADNELIYEDDSQELDYDTANGKATTTTQEQSRSNGSNGGNSGNSEKSTADSNAKQNSSQSQQKEQNRDSSSGSNNNGANDQDIQNENNQNMSSQQPFKSKLPKKATDVLKGWFLNNIKNPYPNHEVKETLSQMTGLSHKQIQNWFTNSRKRFLEPLKRKMESQQVSSSQKEDSGDSATKTEQFQSQNTTSNNTGFKSFSRQPKTSDDKQSYELSNTQQSCQQMNNNLGTQNNNYHIQPQQTHLESTNQSIMSSQSQHNNIQQQQQQQLPSHYTGMSQIPYNQGGGIFIVSSPYMVQNGQIMQPNRQNPQSPQQQQQPTMILLNSNTMQRPMQSNQSQGQYAQFVQLPQGSVLIPVNAQNQGGLIPIQQGQQYHQQYHGAIPIYGGSQQQHYQLQGNQQNYPTVILGNQNFYPSTNGNQEYTSSKNLEKPNLDELNPVNKKIHQ